VSPAAASSPADRFERLVRDKLLERPTIEIEKLGDCAIEFTQREELAIAKAREDPFLHHEGAPPIKKSGSLARKM
jgi:hypothetical protein